MRTTVFAFLVLAASSAAAVRAEDPAPRKLSAVPFNEVKFRDAFWAPRLQTNRQKSLPHNIKWCEQTGRISNFAKAAGLEKGKFEGIFFNDSDLYKVLEGASYSLADRPDPALDKTVDAIIAKIAAAQQPDGYISCYYTLVEPGKRLTDLRSHHEMYCAGHLIEGAVAHYRATGKRTFLDVAVKLADFLDNTFGPTKRHGIDGHEEIELALVKLAQATGQRRYFDLARFFIDIHGDKSQRETWGAYCQDHMPVRQQSEIVGHAVRAMYLYSGVADVAAGSGDRALVDAMGRLWQDVVQRKMYITGGIGARHAGEAFGDAYELPNDSAYCETCAAIGLALWAHRLNLMHGQAQYADVLERVIYNGILSGIDLEGEKFFYVNPLASNGKHHRQPFFGCACCPTNVVRFVPSVPGYAYAVGTAKPQAIYVNLFVAGTAVIDVGGNHVKITQETNYPWDGHVKITLEPERPAEFDVYVRIPAWCRSVTKSSRNLGCVDGYCRFPWRAGDVVELELAMPIERIEAHPSVKADAGRVAVQRGPIVYCFEGVDNGGKVKTIILPHDPKFVAEHRNDLLGGVTVIKGVDRSGRAITAVPYYAWDHREPGEMAVWVRQEGKAKSPPVDAGWQGKLYRPLDPATLGPAEPPTPEEMTTASASHGFSADAIEALNDRIEPKSSHDHDIPRFTWWDHRGTKEWVQYEFDAPRKLSAVEVYWFDDTGRGKCRVPQSWRLLRKEGNKWKPVAGVSSCGTERDKFNRATFPAIETPGLRIEVQLQPEMSGGILEWKVE